MLQRTRTSVQRTLAQTALLAFGTGAVTLLLLWSPPTRADPVSDAERAGEWDDDGMKFGNVVVKGELIAANVPGGWTLLRTFENKSDEPVHCEVEERVLRTETMEGARVSPSPVAVIQRHQTISLGPREKKTVGIYLPRALGDEITENRRLRTSIDAAREHMAQRGEYHHLAIFDKTYFVFEVDYLRPLAPGETVARNESSVSRPGRMPMGDEVQLP